jgi:multidrug efflux pump subunit AcrB
MAGRSVTANLLMLVLLIGGLVMGQNIKKDVFPDFELDLVRISLIYPGASPEEVERATILAVEEVIQGIEGIEEITATASEGSGTVTVEVIEGEDVSEVAQEIKNAVDRISSFPEDAEDPRVTVPSRKRYVDRLLLDPAISQVELSGIREYEISIEIPQNVLRTYGLTLNEVAALVRRAAVEVPGGAIRTEGGDVLVRVTERREVGKEFAKIPVITTPEGTELLLGGHCHHPGRL